MWAGRIRVERTRGDEGRRHVDAWWLAAIGLLASCAMDTTAPATMDSSLGDAGRLDAAAAGDGSAVDAGRREGAATPDAGQAGEAGELGSTADGSYQCVGQSTTTDPCTEFLLNPQLQTQWSLKLSAGDLEIVTAGFDLNVISCTGQFVAGTFRCFATMHVNGAVCDDRLNLQPSTCGDALFWIGEDTSPPPLRAACKRPAP